jgi:peptidoglycan hydrolase-like protein with peptidoglycan-binding domain
MSKKLIALVLAVTFAFSFVAKGATVEELQAQIAALLAQIQALQAQLGQQTTTTGACFTTDLKLGMKSDEVKTLQIKLGVTPATGYFGPKTLAAVKKFQAENGIPTTGYVGPLTRTALNSKFCAPPPTVPPITAPTTPITSVAPSYGSLSVTSYPVSDYQTTLNAGQTYEVVAAQFKATGSDITVKKIPVRFIVTNNNSAFPWTVFNSFSVWEGSTKLAEISAAQTNAIENTFGKDYTYNISGLNWVIPNGQQKVLTVKATLASSISSSVLTALKDSNSFSINLDPNIVYTDIAGVTYTSGAIANDVTIGNSFALSDVKQADISVTTAADNPYDSNVVGSISGTTRFDLMKILLKANNEIGATFNSADGVTLTLGDSALKPYITAVEIWDGNTLVQSAAPTNWSSDNTTSTVSWSNFTLPVAGNSSKELTIKVQLGQLDSSWQGGSDKYVTITAPAFHGIDSNSNLADAKASTALTSNKAYVFYKAPTFALNTATFTSSGTQTNAYRYGNAKIVFSVTANNDDIYLGTDSAKVKLLQVGGSSSSTQPAVLSCTGATTVTNGYRVSNGTAATCEVDYTVDASSTISSADYYQVKIDTLTWYLNSVGNSSSTAQDWGWDNYITNPIKLVNAQ